MLIVIPAAVAQIDATHKRVRLIDGDDFLVMRPKEDANAGVIGMPENANVLVQIDQSLFAVVAIDAQRQFDFFVQEQENANALFLMTEHQKKGPRVDVY